MYIQSFEIDKNCSDNDGNKETGCHKLAKARADSHNLKLYIYPARRACALRALGLLLADGVLTVGWGKTFWRVGRVPTRKRA